MPDTSDTSATRMRYEQHECNTSETRATQMRHECDTSATRTTRVRREWKILILITTRVKVCFHIPTFTLWQVKDHKEEQFHSKYRL